MDALLTLFKTLVVFTVLTILPLQISAQDLESRFADNTAPVKIQRINLQVELDGMSDEPAWEGIESLPLRMRNPIYGSEPSERTKILLGYDDDYLYAAIDVLFGERNPQGKLPITVSEKYPIGFGINVGGERLE